MYKSDSGTDDIDVKVHEFSCAINKYQTFSLYTQFETWLAIVVMILQALSIVNLLHVYQYESGLVFIFVLILAYVTTDFFNGLVHMIVDNNTNYTSITGPFIAAFHMHHFNMRYKEKHAIKVYFTESGHKFWLVIYLVLLAGAQRYLTLDDNLNLGLVAFGVLSSMAEVSHYWCHNLGKKNKLISFLQRYHLLLALKHHRLHHVHDNMNYAFLNGVSDPLLNLIARHCYRGYKSRSDKHVRAYMSALTESAEN